MAQLAMAQEGGQAPAILSRVKTQAADKNVFVRVDILEEDLDELESMLPIPGQRQSSAGNLSVKKDPLIGKKAPRLESVLLDGSKFKLENHKGKVVVLDFWATWCGPCRMEIPHFVKLVDKYEDDLVILGVSVDDPNAYEKIPAFSSNYNINYPILLDDKREVSYMYGGISSIPTTFVLNRQGKALGRIVGARSYEQFEGLLKEIM